MYFEISGDDHHDGDTNASAHDSSAGHDVFSIDDICRGASVRKFAGSENRNAASNVYGSENSGESG